MQQVLADLQRPHKNFFEKRARFPRLKSRKRDRARFRIPQRVIVADGKVYVPKIGLVGIRQSQAVDGATKSHNCRSRPRGWNRPRAQRLRHAVPWRAHSGPRSSSARSCGSCAVRSGVLSRREKGSARRLRAKHKVALVQRKTGQSAQGFSEQVDHRSGGEDLSVKGLVKTKLAKSMADASLGEFRRQLAYKTIWNRSHLAVIDRWYPSSKTCHMCGAVNAALTLADRSWRCECGTHLDRDLNAARNIRAEGLKILAAGHAESKRTGSRYKTSAVGGARC